MMTSTLWALGPAGTNGHEAALGFLRDGDPAASPIAFARTHRDIFDHLVHTPVDRGVVPIENVLAGFVGEVVRFWLTTTDDHPPFGVVGERWVPIRHHLLAHPRVDAISDLSLVVSHPHALQQCEERLSALGIQTEAVSSTAQAAHLVAQDKTGRAVGALASTLAAKTYGLQLLESDVQATMKNATRFFHLSRETVAPTGNDKIALLIWVHHLSGQLDRIIHPIAEAGANMYSIHSIPLGEKEEYAFYLECSGHQDEPQTQRLIRTLRATAKRLIVLGSFPRCET